MVCPALWLLLALGMGMDMGIDIDSTLNHNTVLMDEC